MNDIQFDKQVDIERLVQSNIPSSLVIQDFVNLSKYAQCKIIIM